MEDKENKRKFLQETKSTLYKTGLKLMILGTVMLVGMFLVFGGVNGAVRNMPENFFWFMQKFFTFAFIMGAAGFLYSMTIKIDDEEE